MRGKIVFHGWGGRGKPPKKASLASWALPGLEKIPVSQGLVTLLHICEVIQTPQSRISQEIPCQAQKSHRATISSHLMASVQVFHNVLQVFNDVFLVIHNVLQVFHV